MQLGWPGVSFASSAMARPSEASAASEFCLTKVLGAEPDRKSTRGSPETRLAPVSGE
jgi:hypothetical protein